MEILTEKDMTVRYWEVEQIAKNGKFHTYMQFRSEKQANKYAEERRKIMLRRKAELYGESLIMVHQRALIFSDEIRGHKLTNKDN